MYPYPHLPALLHAPAGQGLTDVPALIPAAIGIKLVGVCVLLYLFSAFEFSLFNGAPGKAGGVALMQGSPENAVCYDAKMNQ